MCTNSPSLNNAKLGEEGGKGTILALAASVASRSTPANTVYKWSGVLELFNDILIKIGGYKFGNRQETISSVLGKNQRSNTLTKAGKILRFILDVIDKDHCKNSINDNLSNTTK